MNWFPIGMFATFVFVEGLLIRKRWASSVQGNVSGAEVERAERASSQFESARELSRYEGELINRRQTWLMLSQTFLLAAYSQANFGIDTSAANDFRAIIATVGALTCTVVWISLLGALFVGHGAYKRMGRNKHAFPMDSVELRQITVYMGDVSVWMIPLSFLAGWLALLFQPEAPMKASLLIGKAAVVVILGGGIGLLLAFVLETGRARWWVKQPVSKGTSEAEASLRLTSTSTPISMPGGEADANQAARGETGECVIQKGAPK